jgi:hypothetical protein
MAHSALLQQQQIRQAPPPLKAGLSEVLEQ